MSRATLGRVVALAMATLLSVGVVSGLGGIGTQTAQATAYRYWTYWHGGPSGWTFATVGSSGVATQGSVEGWRFAVSGVAGSRSTSPHAVWRSRYRYPAPAESRCSDITTSHPP